MRPCLRKNDFGRQDFLLLSLKARLKWTNKREEIVVEHFWVIKFWTDETLGTSLSLKTGIPPSQVEDGLPRRRLSIGLQGEKWVRGWIFRIERSRSRVGLDCGGGVRRC
ncbi:MAG TPA: hypothetical protein VE641_21550, partial [Chthoniobacterales bacterium]|nr:hypothetical protein [Chthoniobacterales bacterium]